MKIQMHLPDKFKEQFRKDRFEDALHRLNADAHLIAGDYEQELAASLIESFKHAIEIGGTFECFHCGSRSVIWDSDFDFSDYGYDGEGIVQVLHCESCGAEIEYKIYCGEDGDEEDGRTDC